MSKTPVQQQLEESLSALVDGEASELELRRLLKADDEQYQELRGRWLRYQTASASIKQDMPSIDYLDLSNSISDAIADEPVPSKASAPVKKTSIWSGVGRFAVAASVAGAVVLGVQFSPSGVDNQIVDVPPTAAPSSKSSSFGHGLPEDTSVRTVSNENTPVNEAVKKPSITISEDTKQQLKDAQEQVNRLMLEHAQNATQNTQQGVLPYARVPESE